MAKVDFSGGYGSVTILPLTQWDKGQVLQIYGLDLNSVEQVHFANKESDSAIVYLAYKQSGGYSEVNIPNSLLERGLDIYAYIYITSGDAGKTVKTIKMPVTARVKPDDFVSEPDKNERAIMEELIAFCNDVCDRTHIFQLISKAEYEALETVDPTVVYLLMDDPVSLEGLYEQVNNIITGEQTVAKADYAETAKTAENVTTLQANLESGAFVPAKAKTAENVTTLQERLTAGTLVPAQAGEARSAGSAAILSGMAEMEINEGTSYDTHYATVQGVGLYLIVLSASGSTFEYQTYTGLIYIDGLQKDAYGLSPTIGIAYNPDNQRLSMASETQYTNGARIAKVFKMALPI